VTIKLTDAATFFNKEQHQIDAWEWLQSQVTPEVLESFSVKYRNKPAKESTITWDVVVKTAKEAGSAWPECVAAQWALESGWGQHTSGKNNYFGLKGSGSTVETKEFINGQWITIKAGFIDFPDLQTCVSYLVDRWYKDFDGHKGVNRATSRNECARLLVKEGYATDPNYSTKLIQIMDRQLQNIGEKKDVDPHASNFTPWSPFTYKITPNITYGELTLNQEARRFTKQYQCAVAKELCLFLERVRKQFGNKPLIITSASRPEPINTQVGGAKNSEHTYSSASTGAIDFYVDGVDINAVQTWCDKNWPYSLGYGAPKGFVHVGIRDGNPRVRWDY
jgi:hypothetical protein